MSKANHQYKLTEIKLYQWHNRNPQVFIHFVCACGKKDLEFKDAEALSKEEAELFYLQFIIKGKVL